MSQSDGGDEDIVSRVLGLIGDEGCLQDLFMAEVRSENEWVGWVISGRHLIYLKHVIGLDVSPHASQLEKV